MTGDRTSPRPAFSETTKGRKTREDPHRSVVRTVYDGPLKLIVWDEDRHPTELYDVENDPGERTNLQGDERGAALQELLERWLARTPQAVATEHEGLDEGTLGRLRALGYVDDD
jgi:arylsulfatase A-like enzyme